MSKNIIYCYSGTGNCLDIAKNIAHELGDTDIVMMRKKPVITDATAYERVGFVFPCYGGGLPGGVEDSVKSIKISYDAYKFGVVSYSGYMGCGMHKLNKLVWLNYWAGISHQCSCVWLFPHKVQMPPVGPERAQKRSEKKAAKIGQDVKAKRATKTPPKKVINMAESAGWPLIAKLKSKKLLASDVCIGCGQCARLCPKGNIEIIGGKATFGRDCIGCLSCLQYCPQSAISLGSITDKREHYHNPKIKVEELMLPMIHID